jgi:phage terminase large subunit GpA-like protein
VLRLTIFSIPRNHIRYRSEPLFGAEAAPHELIAGRGKSINNQKHRPYGIGKFWRCGAPARTP